MIVVIAILASVVAPEVFSKVDTARISTAKSQIEALGTALDSYRLANGSYPTTAQTLDALMHPPQVDPPPSWSGPYMQKAIPLDPWNRPYIYASPPEKNTNPTSYDLYTCGKNGDCSGTGPTDPNSMISNWQ